MKVVYATDEVENVCEKLKTAKKFFNGNVMLANSLMARINALKQADNIKDIIVQLTFHFHKLINKNGRDLEGYFAIDEIAKNVRIVGIAEVDKYYE